MSRVKQWEGCEWDPVTGTPATDEANSHWARAEATWIVGFNGHWRLCDTCAQLPEFARFRVRTRIKDVRP